MDPIDDLGTDFNRATNLTDLVKAWLRHEKERTGESHEKLADRLGLALRTTTRALRTGKLSHANINLLLQNPDFRSAMYALRAREHGQEEQVTKGDLRWDALHARLRAILSYEQVRRLAETLEKLDRSGSLEVGLHQLDQLERVLTTKSLLEKAGEDARKVLRETADYNDQLRQKRSLEDMRAFLEDPPPGFATSKGKKSGH